MLSGPREPTPPKASLRGASCFSQLSARWTCLRRRCSALSPTPTQAWWRSMGEFIPQGAALSQQGREPVDRYSRLSRTIILRDILYPAQRTWWSQDPLPITALSITPTFIDFSSHSPHFLHLLPDVLSQTIWYPVLLKLCFQRNTN